jgi:chromosome segregation ATPase
MSTQQIARPFDIAQHIAKLEHELSVATTQLTSAQLELKTAYERIAECRSHDRNRECYVESLHQDIDSLNAKVKELAKAPVQTQRDLDDSLDLINDLSGKYTDAQISKWMSIGMFIIAALIFVAAIWLVLGGAK